MLFLYLDESGQYTFSRKGSEYFVFAACAMDNPYALQHKLCELEKKLRKDGIMTIESEYFRASEDKQMVRDEVLKVLEESDGFTVDSIVVEKCKSNTALRDEMRLYMRIYKHLLAYVFHRHHEVEKILIFGSFRFSVGHLECRG